MTRTSTWLRDCAPVRTWCALAVAALLVLTGCDQTAPRSDAPAPAPDQVTTSEATGQAIPGQYIVVFNQGVSDVPGLAQRLARQSGGDVGFTYRTALKGFSISVPEQAARALESNPNVAYVEPDRRVQAIGSQSNATWGLDRVDDRDPVLDDEYTYNETGTGVTAYIIDTGIRTSHNDFGGRATVGFDAFSDGQNGQDCDGHGTHVAGTVGGTTYGVAKAVDLVAVRVLDCEGSGTTSGVIAGVDWVTANAAKPAVANMSLGGGASSSLDDAVSTSIASGVQYAIAAGNGDFLGREQDACNSSPARVPEAITIGATDDTDAKASFSNYGSCVDWFAPGVNITSAWIGSNSDTNTISGTSMAAPHVAGATALFLESYPSATPQTVRDSLYAATTKDIVTDSRTSNNHLLYTLRDGSSGSDGGSDDGSGSISLSANGYKQKGRHTIDLSWSGATSSDVDVYRNGGAIATTTNDGAYTDVTNNRGGASYTYQICEAGTSTCSGEATVTF